MASRKQIKNLLPILQAFADGKTIECCVIGTNHWSDYPCDGDFRLYDEDRETEYEYRIKPEKKSAWVAVFPDGSMSRPFVDKKQAQLHLASGNVREIHWEE